MNKKGYCGYDFNQAIVTTIMIAGLLIFLNFMGFFNQGQIVEVSQNPVDSVTELQRNYDNLVVINQELTELVDWDFYAENQELQKKLDKSTSIGALIFCNILFLIAGMLLGVILNDWYNKRKKRKKK